MLPLIEVDVEATNTHLSDVFRRLATGDVLDTEEVRIDIPAVLASGYIYKGYAPDGTATSATSWDVMRVSLDVNGNPSRQQYQTGISWDSRASGW